MALQLVSEVGCLITRKIVLLASPHAMFESVFVHLPDMPHRQLTWISGLSDLNFTVYDTTQILSEKRKWKRSSRLYYEYHYVHAALSIFMRWLTTSYSNLSHIIRILPYNKSARTGRNSYHRSVHYFFMTLTLWFSNFQQDRDSIPKLFIALHGRNLILEYGRSNIAGTK